MEIECDNKCGNNIGAIYYLDGRNICEECIEVENDSR
jgi:hypothetical protein|tara:strand:- start:775 stop:885 length:111 start_codon:yes stop_codon:yes gene_type:complete